MSLSSCARTAFFGVGTLGAEHSNIWLTSRTRMEAERRLLLYGKISHLVISYYSIILIIFNVFSNFFEERYTYYYEINIALSVIILCGSLISHGFRFEKTAASHRDCYLKLQELFSSPLTGQEKDSRYSQILYGYPNHGTQDYNNMIVREILFFKKNLANSTGPILLSKYNIVSFFVWKALLVISVAAVFLIPVVLFGIAHLEFLNGV
ncbi:SLATT domain-containing protein [Chelativorans salis]|uniref:SLATT domain-containing protein n=1 Tax=Chelativorans salis TaxID=2978478 RepID=UPI003CC6577F